MNKEDRAKGRDFMNWVKERWDQKYPEYQQASWQKLRDNAAWFKKEPELISSSSSAEKRTASARSGAAIRGGRREDKFRKSHCESS